MEKLKVVWICHFSNKEVRQHLPLLNLSLRKSIRSLLGKSDNNYYADFAPWVTSWIKEFERFPDIELHVISPHFGMKHITFEFESKSINYHFFRPELPFMADRIFETILNPKRRQYWFNRFIVKRFIKNISPDIVNLIGTENPYYSITVLDIINKPVFVSAQTVYTNPNRNILSGNVDQQRWEIELKIHKKEKYFGCGGRMHHDLILNNNPNAIIFKNMFPIQRPAGVVEVSKEYDFVFFAAVVNMKKGIEDAIDALAIVNNEKSQVTLNVVGRCTQVYKHLLLQKIERLHLEDNVTFNDYFPIHADMHQHIKKAKFAVLPIKLDDISSTVIEAMLLELPVATYITTGTPYLNKNGETVLLAEIGDIDKLAKNMIRLLQEPELGERLKKAAKAFVEIEFDNSKSAKQLAANYRAAIEHYHHNTRVPKGLLFNTEEFPKYK